AFAGARLRRTRAASPRSNRRDAAIDGRRLFRRKCLCRTWNGKWRFAAQSTRPFVGGVNMNGDGTATVMQPVGQNVSDVDLRTILDAWNEAPSRLQATHELLRAEVRRLTDEFEVKNRELARRNRLADLGQM